SARVREIRSRFRLSLRHGFNGLQVTAEGTTGEKGILCGPDEADWNVVGGVTVFLEGGPLDFRKACEEAGDFDVVARDGFTNFLEDMRGVFVMERFAEALFFELMRKDAEQVEVTARAHDFGGFVQRLYFATGVGDGAVFFVCGCGWEDDVG